MAAQAAATLSDFKAPAQDTQLNSDYEFEDPAQAWISLCEATRLLDTEKRAEACRMMVNLARNSHWDQQLYDTELELEAADAEYGGPFPGEEDFPPEGSFPNTQEYTDEDEGKTLDQDIENFAGSDGYTMKD